ncbi:DUF4352 domain-containing protein [Kribbella sp. C-35]|uniref:DUF4352 domain-containing protein n=1 Tax=Kribbella sp. C-35 TaxID=2789276 RepID=UPI0039794FD6
MTFRRGVLLPLVGLAVMTAAGCDSTEPQSTPTPTYRLEPRPVRPGEVALDGHAVSDGDTTFFPIGLTTGLDMLVGSHAEFAPKGEFVRVRVVVTNKGRSSVLFNTRRQLLVLADGKQLKPDDPAMLVKRQPGQFELGPADRLEFDLYYDMPKGAQVVALMGFGGPTLTDMKDATGTRIPLT